MCLLELIPGSACTMCILRKLTHHDGVCKVDTWLVVEEVRTHQFVMACRMVFGVLVAKVGASVGPVNLELALEGAIPDPVQAHVDFL